MNELTAWISAIRKTIKYNVCRVETFHPGVFKGDKWNCCRKEQDTGGFFDMLLLVLLSFGLSSRPNVENNCEAFWANQAEVARPSFEI